MKYIELRKQIRAAVFSGQDLRLLKGRVFGCQLSRWQKQGYIRKLKNGLYAFEEQIERVSPEEIAGLLYAPSYISLEKALSIYGFIPEMVYAVTAVTPKTTRSFKNAAGSFHYRHIKPALYFGYREGEGRKFMIAEPEKALLDYLYFNQNQIRGRGDIKALRLNIKEIKKQFAVSKLFNYLALFNNQKMKKAVELILGGG